MLRKIMTAACLRRVRFHESSAVSVARWYASALAEVVSATWCATEFASALGIKQRAGQMNAKQVHVAKPQARTGLQTHCILRAPCKPAQRVSQHVDDVLRSNARRLKIKAVFV